MELFKDILGNSINVDGGFYWNAYAGFDPKTRITKYIISICDVAYEVTEDTWNDFLSEHD